MTATRSLIDRLGAPTNRPWIVFIAGPNGAGKSTLAHQLLPATDPPLPFINVDDIARSLSPSAVAKAAIAAGRHGLRRMSHMIATMQSFAVETTLSGGAHMRIAAEARRKNWFIELVYVYVSSSELSLRRVEERVSTGGHDIPADDVVRRYERSLANLWRLIQFCDRWLLLDNSNEPYRLVAAGDQNGIVIHDEIVFRRIEEYRSSKADPAASAE